MKRILFFIFLLPLVAAAQKIRVNELDKFIKQRRVETFPLTLLSASKIKLAVTIGTVGTSAYMQLSGAGIGANRIDVNDRVIFLFDNDSTVTIRSKGYQNYEIGVSVNSYKHNYVLTLDDIIKMSQYNLQAMRKYHADEFDDIYITKENSEQFKKLTLLFIEELVKEKLIPTVQQIEAKDVVRHVGDSVTLVGRISGGRYLFESKEATTLLDVGGTFPNQQLTVVINSEDKNLFGIEPQNAYAGKLARISGRVEMNLGKPHINIKKKEQLVLLEDTTGVANKPLQLQTEPVSTMPVAKATVAARAPGFPGGYEVWMQFLNRNLKPPAELAPGEKKTVVVQFLISADGSVSNVQVLQSAGAAFDKEVLRVLQRMPKWKAAIENGRPANAVITQPVTFYGVAAAPRI